MYHPQHLAHSFVDFTGLHGRQGPELGLYLLLFDYVNYAYTLSAREFN